MSRKTRYEYQPDFAVSPGETLKETMEFKNLTLKELAARTDLTEQSLIRIMKGDQPLTRETAYKLEPVTGITAQFWNNMESRYREQLLLLKEKESLRKDLEWLKKIPVQELVKRGMIKPCKEPYDQLREVFAFYGVSSVEAWTNVWLEPKISARRSTCFYTNPEAASAWIREGELKAKSIKTKPFSKTAFNATLLTVRKMTKDLPKNFALEIQNLLAECGVALVFVQEIPKVPWNGATEWISSDKAMILLSLRGKKDDLLWFSFFHEACHVLKHWKKNTLLINNENDQDPKEIEADQFAADFLIPEEYNKRIIEAQKEAELLSIAEELEIAPGIVAGRYQFLTKKWNKFNNLKKTLQWST
jgi:addiction module HigA family antidote